jgi:hypothetical protein
MNEWLERNAVFRARERERQAMALVFMMMEQEHRNHVIGRAFLDFAEIRLHSSECAEPHETLDQG